MKRKIPRLSKADRAYCEMVGEARAYASRAAVLYKKSKGPVTALHVLIAISKKPILFERDGKKIDEIQAYLDYACTLGIEGLNRYHNNGAVLYAPDSRDNRYSAHPKQKKPGFNTQARKASRFADFFNLGINPQTPRTLVARI